MQNDFTNIISGNTNFTKYVLRSGAVNVTKFTGKQLCQYLTPGRVISLKILFSENIIEIDNLSGKYMQFFTISKNSG